MDSDSGDEEMVIDIPQITKQFQTTQKILVPFVLNGVSPKRQIILQQE